MLFILKKFMQSLDIFRRHLRVLHTCCLKKTSSLRTCALTLVLQTINISEFNKIKDDMVHIRYIFMNFGSKLELWQFTGFYGPKRGNEKQFNATLH